MAWRFNPPPTWPAPPEGWVPPDGWVPDPSWPPAPPGWQFWVQDQAPTGQPSGTAFAAPAHAPRRRGPARVLLVLVVLLAVVVLATAALATIAAVTRRTQAQELTTATSSAEVRVDNACGPVALRPGSAGQVSTRATIRYGWRVPTVTSRVEGDAVVIRVSCPALALGSSVSLVVDVPPGGAVQARSSAGSLQAEGVSSDLDLRTSAGSITATGVSSRRVSADTSAGSVTLTWAADADPTAITATSSAGSVTVRVPDVTGAAYRVTADSSAGSTTVNVRTDPQAVRSITATSSAGSVLVDYR